MIIWQMDQTIIIRTSIQAEIYVQFGMSAEQNKELTIREIWMKTKFDI
jgi:hypothetical protein